MKLLRVDSLEQAREKLLKQITWDIKKTEVIPIEEAAGRVLSRDVKAEVPLPSFLRSTVDGYAVIAADTQGASDGVPVFLDIIEEIEIGKPAKKRVVSGTCSYVPTGGMIPEGADAVVMVEYCELFDQSCTAVYHALASGRNVVQIGEDVEKGETILPRGTRLAAAQIGALAGNGRRAVEVYRPLKVTILSTGDELVQAGGELGLAQVYDINTPALRQLAREIGFEEVKTQVLPDQEELLEKALRLGMEDSDLVVISGGSSQGKKDITAKLLDRLADPGVFTHGLALKPGKPTILAVDEPSQTILMGLPGHPAAALMVFRLLAKWLEQWRTGEADSLKIPASMQSNIPAAPGKDTCVMVELFPGDGEGYTARPVLGKSGLMRTLTKADGYVRIPMGKEGLKTGELVWVELF